MSSKSFTTKQYNAAKKRRSTTMKKLDKIYASADKFIEEAEEFRRKWMACTEKIYDTPTKHTRKVVKKKESDCNKLLKQLKQKEKKKDELYKKAEELEEIVDEIHVKYHIAENEPY
jgi:hypothetical protein